MKNYINIFKPGLVLATALFIASCGILDTDRDPALFDGDQEVKFVNTSPTFVVEEAQETYTFQLNTLKPVRGTQTFTFEVVAEGTTAQEGVHYQLPSTSVTIADGEVFGEAQITLLSAGFGAAIETLVLRITSPEAASFSNVATLNLQRFFPYVQAEFVGRYRVTYPWWEANPYEIDMIAGASENQLVAVDMLGEGVDFTITVDVSDRNNFTASFLETGVWTHPAGQVRVFSTAGSFSPATYTFNFSVSQDIPGVGAFPANQPMTLQKID
ncbi:MAG: hypothetical protein JJU41_06685 [Bacteroidetes bacterium]|nr:hypothetical protein [Bacteroidota bacterium]MCH8523116.1 hypothetical protein [Balneolales bacterium]